MAQESILSIANGREADQGPSQDEVQEEPWTRPEQLSHVKLPDREVRAALDMLGRMVDPSTGRIMPRIDRPSFTRIFPDVDVDLLERVQRLHATASAGTKVRTGLRLKLGSSANAAEALALGHASRILASGNFINGQQVAAYVKEVGPIIRYAHSQHTRRSS